MKKILALGILGILVAFAFALGTSASFKDFEVSRSTHIAVVSDDVELIDLHPGQPYAYIDNVTGKLVIDISQDNPKYPWQDGMGSGISVGSHYNFDHIFYVSNDLWENKNITVRVVSSDDNVAFYHSGGEIKGTFSGEIPTESDEAITDVCFVLEPGEELGLGMEFTGGALGMHNSTITVYAWPEEDFNCPGGAPQ